MKIFKRLQSCFVRSRMEADLAEEMRIHHEMLEQQLIREDMTPGEARLAAVRRFGNNTFAIEESREQWRFMRLESILMDLRFALRLMRRQPMLTLIAILTIAFGVGANTAIVSVLQTVLLNPLGLRQTDRVMVARERLDKLNMRHVQTSAIEFQEVESMTDAFSAVAAMEGHYWISKAGGEAVRLVGQSVTPDFFKVFSVQPVLGRFFHSQDQDTVVVSYSLWQSRFGGDPAVLGRMMALDNRTHRIVGVAPAEFRFPVNSQIWTHLDLKPDRFRRGYNMNLWIFARLKDGISPAQAADHVNRYYDGLKSPDSAEGRELTEYGYGIELDPFAHYVAGDLRHPLWLIWSAAFLVLLTGCANVAGLLLTRTSSRGREIAIRISLGASPGRIIRQLMLESLLLSAIGGASGLLMTSMVVSFFTRLTFPGSQLLALVSVNKTLLLYGISLALLSGLLFGLVPATQLLRESQTDAMARHRRIRFQYLLVAVEVAGAFFIIIITVLLLRSLWSVRQIKTGFDTADLTTAVLLKPGNDPGIVDRLQVAIRSMAGIQSAALAYPIPFRGSGLTSGFDIKNRQFQPGEPEWHGEAYFISADYLSTLRIPLLRGRNLSDFDTADSALVCLIDAKLASRFFPDQDPIGREISMYAGWARIVGVVGAIRGTTLEEGSRPVAYYALAQVAGQVRFFREVAIVVRSRQSAAGAIREAVRRANTSAPVYDMRSMEDRIGESLAIRRLLVMLLCTFGVISLLLACIGIYGVIAQLVGERMREIGIRMALGARSGQILMQFMSLGLRTGFIGLVLGFAAAANVQRWIVGMLFEVKPFDLASFCSAAVLVLSLLLCALWWPARRASRIDPQQALRCE